MEAIIVNNRINLVNDYAQIKITLKVPALNLQKMKMLLNCSIISKQEIELPHNHNAGKIYSVVIRVKFATLKQYMMRDNCHGCENKAEYLNLLNISSLSYASYHESNLLCEKVPLYAFGNCYQFKNGKEFNSVYTNKNGHKISLVHTEQNKLGKARYINFKGQWYSNKKY
jgi:hypothetical protein